MSAYIIVDVQVTDPEVYTGYTKLVPATVEAYGGKFIVRGGAAENMEGGWEPQPGGCARIRERGTSQGLVSLRGVP